MDSSCSNYHCSVTPLGSSDSLALEWQELEAQATNEFFLSWLWIKTWLEVFTPAVFVLRVMAGEQLVAMALLSNSVEVRHKWLRSKVLRFHQTGIPAQDQLWIEYNDLLVASDHIGKVEQACIDFLQAQVPGWDELVLGASTESRLQHFSHEQLHKHTLWSAPCYGVDLAELRQQGQEYLPSLSKNTRAQLRRARRDAEAMGDLRFVKVAHTEQALAAFTDIGQLHQQRWGDASGFSNPAFVLFHQTLIRRAMPAGAIEFFRLELDGKLVAGLYNFLYRGKVYFYLSGIEYNSFDSIKPGMLCHAECIQAHLSTGSNFYDFMGGDAQYKRSLATQSARLYTVAFQKTTPSLWLEQKLRWLKVLMPHG